MDRCSRLPEAFLQEASALIHELLPSADAATAAACMDEAARRFSPSLSISAFRIVARSAVLAAAQHAAVCNAANDPATLRKHAARTIDRCLPGFADEAVLDRCMQALQTADDMGDPMLTGAIHQFAASELLALQDDTPYHARLHQAALQYLPLTRPVDRDDLRLVALAALYEPGRLPRGQHDAILRHRLGLNGAGSHSYEEVAAMMHLPPTTVRETVAAALTILAARHTDRSDSHA